MPYFEGSLIAYRHHFEDFELPDIISGCNAKAFKSSETAVQISYSCPLADGWAQQLQCPDTNKDKRPVRVRV